MTRKYARIGAGAAAALLGASMLTPAFAGSAGACDACALEARVATLEAQMAQAKRGGVDVPSDLTLKFGGYVKADFNYDLNKETGLTQFAPGLFSSASDGGFRAHANQTRFNFTATKDTALGPIKAFFEVDFFSGTGNQALSNSASPRMRHAFVEWNGILAGQTWSNFMPIAFYPSTLDFQGPSGINFIRQAQLRITREVAPGLKLSISAENPETIDGNNNNNSEDIPDFIAAIHYAQPQYQFRLAGVIRKIEDQTAASNTETGYGVSVGGEVKPWAGGSIMGNFTWGKGIGRYLIDGAFINAGDLRSDTLVADDIEQWGAVASISQQLTDVIRVGLTGGYHKVEDTFLVTDIEEIRTLHGTIFWTPVERYTVAAEVSWFEAERVNGGDAENVRIQGAVQFNF